MTIYSHNLAADILEIFDDKLDRMGITLPSPEDDQRDPDNGARLYGSTYSDLLDEVEDYLVSVLADIKGVEIRFGTFA